MKQLCKLGLNKSVPKRWFLVRKRWFLARKRKFPVPDISPEPWRAKLINFWNPISSHLDIRSIPSLQFCILQKYFQWRPAVIKPWALPLEGPQMVEGNIMPSGNLLKSSLNYRWMTHVSGKWFDPQEDPGLYIWRPVRDPDKNWAWSPKLPVLSPDKQLVSVLYCYIWCPDNGRPLTIDRYICCGV